MARTVLVVDDEESIRSVLGRMFERRGWHVVHAATFAEAEARIFVAHEGPSYDLILCDLNLDGSSGLTLYQRIASEAPVLAGRFVLSTGDATDVVVPCPILEKPFTMQELLGLAEQIAADGRTQAA
ncbi:MAG: response regulator [Gemmatimonadaceae bacterium]|nr:response regulator [Gemmatimonadaceae bacterium]